jgi:hypothetical protein
VEVIDDLALLLTSGRLSQENRDIIIDAYNATILHYNKSAAEALINAQQLMTLSPEFKTNGLVQKTGNARSTAPKPEEPNNPYKSVIYVLLSGGYDSFNLSVPKEGCNRTDVAGQTACEQYDQERGVMAFSWDKGEGGGMTVTEHAEDSQPCSVFAIHGEMPILKMLYEEDALAFFANTGVINHNNMAKTNYSALTATELFAHNAMLQEENKKADPFDTKIGTGVLGRVKDFLMMEGFNVNTILINHPSIAMEGVPVSLATTIVSSKGAKLFGARPEEEDYFDIEVYAKALNSEMESISN